MYAVDIARDEAAAKLAPCEEADVSFLLTPYTDRKISIRLDRRMYSIKQEAEANWVWHAFRGFAKVEQQLAALGRSPQSFAAIGTGSGLDAIGAAHIFPSLRRIIVTDVEEPLARLAAANVRANVGDHIKVEALAGDVCLPLAESGLSVDVIYANLPNIPVGRDAAIIDHGTFYRPGEDGTGDALLDRYLLGLQHHFLRSAKHALRPDGVALLMIGGRFPYRIFDRLAAGAGFAFDEVLCYFKRQTEADNVVSGYAAAEAAGVEFDFYDFDAARATLRGGEQLSGRALKAAIEPWRLSAHAAQEHLRAGREIGHTLHFLKATPLSAA
jgi:methylase of polypeptide subunit release factors